MKRILLNGNWKFRTDKENALTEKKAYEHILEAEHTVSVPSPIQDLMYLREEYPSIAMNNAYLGTAWYETEFEAQHLEDEYVSLCFNGVCPYATVYINGSFAGEISNPHIAHTFDITKLVNSGKNRLTVLIEEKNKDLLGGLRFDVLNWSGIYGDVSIIIDKNAYYFGDFVSTSLEDNAFEIGCNVKTDCNLEYEIEIFDKDISVLKSDAVLKDDLIKAIFPLDGMKLWNTDSPHIYKAEIKAVSNGEFFNSHSFEFGLRELKSEGTRIYLNGKPLYIFGGGEEYFSVDIMPLKDREIIRKRFSKLKEMGFNFFRYHTHVPSIEEIEEADRMGLLLSAEIPVLSNFNRIKDIEKGYEILKAYVNQTKAHPSLAIYCLGNEGAQLLVREDGACDIAKKGYEIIKQNTKNQFAIICFGFQGEAPQLENDMWTPHIWSQEFRWAYQGLTQTPWDFLDSSIEGHPCVIHEYGKFGIFPDVRLDDFIRETGYKLSVKEHTDGLFEESSDLYELLPQIQKNSRLLALDCIKLSFEAMRRKNYISGYVFWTLFYMGVRSSGFCDDYGNECFFDPKILKNGANSPLGIFVDKDFSGRTYYSTEKDTLSITVSNFSYDDIENAYIECRISDKSGIIYSFKKENVSIPVGNAEIKAEFEYAMHVVNCETELFIEFSLNKDGKILCKNNTKVWCYPIRRAIMPKCSVIHIKNKGLNDNIYSSVNNITDIWNYISVVLGCVIPEYGFNPTEDNIVGYLELTLKKRKPSFMITDMFDDVAKIMLENGVPVFFIDSGNFPESFYPEKIPANAHFFDLNNFYAPFRSGWDEGNVATIIKGNTCLCEEKEDTYADLRYFDMTDGAMPLLTKSVITEMGIKNPEVQFRLIQKIKDKSKTTKNISVYFEKIQKKKVNDCFYFMKGTINKTPVIISSCNYFKDANGKYIFTKVLEEKN